MNLSQLYISVTSVDAKTTPTLKERLMHLQKSYSESFSIHGLTRIIYSGKIQRMLWCVIFFAALVGLAYMSREILDNFFNKEVRTEVRSEQQESQPWPSITICSEAALMKHFTCHYKRNFTPFTPPDFCLKELKVSTRKFLT